MTASLTEEQVLLMKSLSTIVIKTGCEAKDADDKSLPTTAYIIDCTDEDKKWKDIVMGDRVVIFDAYYDTFKKNVIQSMNWTSGTINPTLWNNIKSPKPPRKRRKKKEKEVE